jgi:hypothetical protein
MTWRSLLSLVAVLVAVTSCDSVPTPAPCVDVPDGGCPEDNGADVCEDPTCAAVYECVSGAWVFQQQCPPHPHDASADVSEAGNDASADAQPDVHIDAPAGAYGGPGCVDLEMPDCPVGIGLACAGMVGCCGCEDLFACVEGGWNDWGVCNEAGVVPNH